MSRTLKPDPVHQQPKAIMQIPFDQRRNGKRAKIPLCCNRSRQWLHRGHQTSEGPKPSLPPLKDRTSQNGAPR